MSTHYYKTKESGIYEVRCLVNDKKYVGSTNNLRYRLNTHKYKLQTGTHHNEHLQSAWDKYGEAMFTFTILEKCNEELLFEREEYWMILLHSLDRNRGYNACLPGALSYKGNNRRERKKSTRTCKKIVRIDSISVIKGLTKHSILEKDNITLKILVKILGYWANFPNGKKNKSNRGIIYVYEEDYKEDFDYLNYKKMREYKYKEPKSDTNLYKRF